MTYPIVPVTIVTCSFGFRFPMRATRVLDPLPEEENTHEPKQPSWPLETDSQHQQTPSLFLLISLIWPPRTLFLLFFGDATCVWMCSVFVPRTFHHMSSQVIIDSCHHIDIRFFMLASTRRAVHLVLRIRIYFVSIKVDYNLASIFSACSYILSACFTSSVSVASLSATTTFPRKPDSPGPISKIHQIRPRRCKSRFSNETDVLQRPRQNK